MGFPRSGTSLMPNLIKSSRVYFGKDGQFRKPDHINSQGFFEYKTIFSLGRKFLKHDTYSSDGDFRVKGCINKLKRISTDIKDVLNALEKVKIT